MNEETKIVNTFIERTNKYKKAMTKSILTMLIGVGFMIVTSVFAYFPAIAAFRIIPLLISAVAILKGLLSLKITISEGP